MAIMQRRGRRADSRLRRVGVPALEAVVVLDEHAAHAIRAEDVAEALDVRGGSRGERQWQRVRRKSRDHAVAQGSVENWRSTWRTLLAHHELNVVRVREEVLHAV